MSTLSIDMSDHDYSYGWGDLDNLQTEDNMTTEAEFHEMAHDLCLKMTALLGREKFADFWQRNVVALNDIIFWDYKVLFGVLNQEYQCLKKAQDQLFINQYAEDIIRIKEYQQQMHDERP